MNQSDYDNRTAVHIAASEGHVHILRLLIEDFGADHSPVDRWGGTPLDDALRSGHKHVQSFLEDKRATRGIAGHHPVARSLWVCPDAMEAVLSGRLFTAQEMPTNPGDPGASELVAQALCSFDGDVLKIHNMTNGHALLTVGLAILDFHDLFSALSLDRATMTRFLQAAESNYGNNGYHNSRHGADVALSVHLFFTQFGLVKRLSKLELFSLIIAAIMHDFNHPGTMNAHEIRTHTERALTHSDDSVLESHHLESTFTLLKQPQLDIFAKMKPEDQSMCRDIIIKTVLITDMAKHNDFVGCLKTLASTRGFAAAQAQGKEDEWTSPLSDSDAVNLQFLLNIAVKWADLGHVCKLNDLHRLWTSMVRRSSHRCPLMEANSPCLSFFCRRSLKNSGALVTVSLRWEFTFPHCAIGRQTRTSRHINSDSSSLCATLSSHSWPIW